MVAILLLAGIYWYFSHRQPPVKNAGQPVERVVAFGDSLTAGFGAGGAKNAYPAVLEKLTGRRVINLGQSGETAAHAPARLAEVLAWQPQMVLIEFGANDFMRSYSQAEAVAAVAKIVDAVQAAGAIAVVVDTGGPGMKDYSVAYEKLAREKQALFVPGIMRGIFNKGNLKSDMIHPNGEGYKLIAQRVYKVIAPYLK